MIKIAKNTKALNLHVLDIKHPKPFNYSGNTGGSQEMAMIVTQ